jgi:hypothetical protein
MKIGKYLLLIMAIMAITIPVYKYRSKLKKHYRIYFLAKAVKKNSGCPNCAALFRDNVKTHNKAYLKEGIAPQKEFKDLDLLHKKNILCKISGTKYYQINKLNHSKPYLLSKASLFLEKLGTAYEEKCNNQQVSYVPFHLSSVTRSESSVQKLMGVNKNSIKESAHLKGKTFDISYVDFNQHKKQLELFIEALKELQQQKKCFVKYETTGCLHITVN